MINLQIAHGGGVNNRGKINQNNVTKEQLLYSINSGFKLIEIDICYIENTISVVHGPTHKSQITFENVIDIAVTNNIRIILDIKGTKKIFKKSLDIINNYIKKHNAQDNFIIQVYNYGDIVYLNSLKVFKNVLIANWKSYPSIDEIGNMITYCDKNQINIVGTSLWSKYSKNFYKHCNYYEFYANKNIQIYVHGEGCNDSTIVYDYLKNNIGIFSKLKFIR
jgi:hypothetical protein